MTYHLTAPGHHALTMQERVELQQNDEDNAARILSSYGDDLVFVSGRGWAVWDGTRYSLRSGKLAAREIAHKLRRLVLEESEWARWNYVPPDWQVEKVMIEGQKSRPKRHFEPQSAIEEIRRGIATELKKHATKCGNIAKVRTALEACEHQRRAEVEGMDNNPWVLVLPDGMLDLWAARDWQRPQACEVAEETRARRSWFRRLDRGVLPTKCAGTRYDAKAACPNWVDFMALILPDPAIRACLQRALGACLFGENPAQICLFLRGPGGNGKSTLLNIFSHVLGSRDGYAASCKIEMFLETGQTQASAATPEETDLPGARAYIATEPGARDVLGSRA